MMRSSTSGRDSTMHYVVACGVAAVSAYSLLHLLQKAFPPKRKEGPQVVLITGASAGIGLSTALKLLQDGHVVYGAARRVDRMKEMVDNGGHLLALDVVNEKQIVKVVAQIIEEQGRIDALINNAGYGAYGALEEVPLDEARRQFDVNLFGLARLTQEVVPHMRKARSGSIVNVSSIAGKVHNLFGGWYHSTKFALECYSDCLRLELKEFGINVVIVEPGVIKTDFIEVMGPPFLERSTGGPYEQKAKKFLENFSKMFERGSDPSLIADTMATAITLQKPARRYLVGAYKEIVVLRQWLGDRIYDYLVLASVKDDLLNRTT